MIDVKNASNNGMNCLNGSYPLTLATEEINMKKELIERLRRFLTAHDMIGTPASDEQVLCAEQELARVWCPA